MPRVSNPKKIKKAQLHPCLGNGLSLRMKTRAKSILRSMSSLSLLSDMGITFFPYNGTNHKEGDCRT